MKVLALSNSAEDVRNFCDGHELYLFKIRQLPPGEHDFRRFEEIYHNLADSLDLGSVDLVVAEYIESLPLVYFMRRAGYYCPALIIPHTNPYPFNILFYFILLSENRHPGDRIICGSENAARAYREVTRIPARPICTFGIQDIYQRTDQVASRRQLGLPQDRQILLYTGRFMNDKGIAQLLAGYHRLRSEMSDVLLVMSATHIDDDYYNDLAAELADVVLYRWLDRSRTVDLYNAADVYVSAATSVWETYGKAPLEALACGIPVVVPRWDGFPYFVNGTNGALVEVEYFPEHRSSLFEFAQANVIDFADKCRLVLESRPDLECFVPNWGTYKHTVEALTALISEMVMYEGSHAAHPAEQIDPERYSPAVQDILKHYHMGTISQLLEKAHRSGFIDQSCVDNEALLRGLHHEIFGLMDAENKEPL